MGTINTTNLPESVPNTVAAAPGRKPVNPSPDTSNTAIEQTRPQDEFQLTNLSSVLNGLKKGAAVMRAKAAQIMSAVKSGTYQVDSLQVSRSIVHDSLASPN